MKVLGGIVIAWLLLAGYYEQVTTGQFFGILCGLGVFMAMWDRAHKGE